MQPGSISEVKEIMRDFAAFTGLSPISSAPQRYLWTDAFAVCNLLELFRQTHDKVWQDLALQLVDQVHFILGRHRTDDSRCGWISGLDDAEGQLHPTIGGLRIGKRLNERKPGEPPDESRKWEQDGQYFHYLTKWMHALNCVSKAINSPLYTQWAIELAQTAHAAFTSASLDGTKQLYWKMSIDLTRPLVRSMGQHDPLDGYVTYSQLQESIGRGLAPEFSLKDQISDMAAICRGKEWLTDDPLGIGGLLWDAWRMVQLIDLGVFKDMQLLSSVVDAARAGLRTFVRSNVLKMPAGYRLAFRELGLAIGLKGVLPLRSWSEKNVRLYAPQSSLKQNIQALMEFVPLAGEIERFWLEGRHREAATWREHREINRVMFATSLAPDRFLSIA